ncbi:uncharacterized protein LOC113352646 [Papaver somniferum]|uniref:uncharacterized protein LOC113352646 n=1 Tax=Papaver somniferum TaxID=3469 RepID=UPI000E705AA2|nr:uncharacterized protein LOC113352646 [Papaver somniferum]
MLKSTNKQDHTFRDVVFDEIAFPYANLFQSQDSTSATLSSMSIVPSQVTTSAPTISNEVTVPVSSEKNIFTKLPPLTASPPSFTANAHPMQMRGYSDTVFPHHVCKLQKALYVLKQAPRAWFERLRKFLLQSGFQSSKSDTSLFYRVTASTTIYILIYVDDILITVNCPFTIHSLITSMNNEFAIKDLGELHFFLGIQHTHTSDGIHLSQTQYISNLLSKTKMSVCKPSDTPYSKPQPAEHSPLFEDAVLYRSTVGALQYARITRPDIAFAVKKSCQYMHAPTEAHWCAVKRILRYLQGTLSFGLQFRKSSSLQLQAYSDADWDGDTYDGRSTSGMAIFLGPNLISRYSRKQKTV